MKYYLGRLDVYEFAELSKADFYNTISRGDDHQFWTMVWEMLLGAQLYELGLNPRAPSGGAPDFLVEQDGRRIWIEAVCPSAEGYDEGRFDVHGREIVSVTHAERQDFDDYQLRITQALQVKLAALEGRTDPETNEFVAGYRQKPSPSEPVVEASDSYVIAINTHRLGGISGFGLSGWPAVAECVFPLGPMQVKMSRATGEVRSVGYEARSHILKTNAQGEVVPIPTYSFLNQEYGGVSAVLSSSLVHPRPDGPLPLTLVHNPLARSPIPRGLFNPRDEVDAQDVGESIEITRLKHGA